MSWSESTVMLSTQIWSGEPFPTPSNRCLSGADVQEESCTQNLLTQVRFKAQPFPCSAGHTQAQVSLGHMPPVEFLRGLLTDQEARAGWRDGHTGCLAN